MPHPSAHSSQHVAQPHQAAALRVLDGLPRQLLLTAIAALCCLLVAFVLLAPSAIAAEALPQLLRGVILTAATIALLGALPMILGLAVYHMPPRPAPAAPRRNTPLVPHPHQPAPTTPAAGIERPPRCVRWA